MPMLQQPICTETKAQLQADQCVNCEREAEEFDDDGFCQDCVIEIGISRQEANNDRD